MLKLNPRKRSIISNCSTLFLIIVTITYVCIPKSTKKFESELSHYTFDQIIPTAEDWPIKVGNANEDSWIYDTTTPDSSINVIKGNLQYRPFDPRFTLGIYLHNLKYKDELPFHWYDWVDLSKLHHYLLSPLDEKPICNIFQGDNLDDTRPFCLNQLTPDPSDIGFQILDPPKITMNEKRLKLAAKSHLYSFAKPPYKVIFLSSRSKMLEFTVAGKSSISEANLTHSFLKFNPTGELNILNEFHLAELNIGHKNEKNLPSEIYIPKESFQINVTDIIANMSSNRASLKPNELSYLESLEYSIFETARNSQVKYFHEPKISTTHKGYHYDWRFFNGVQVDDYQKSAILHRLIRTWLDFSAKADIKTWIAHGTLLSWHWNGLLFPWDDDIDVQMPIADLHKLALSYNQSIIVEDIDQGFGRYFLDIGSFITERTYGNGLNNIDARFIDIDTGMYIDITALSVSSNLKPEHYKTTKNSEVFNCRNSHFVSYDEISPIKKTIVEGAVAYVPNQYEKILSYEYEKGLIEHRYAGFTFVQQIKLWINSRDLHNYMKYPNLWVENHDLSYTNSKIPQQITQDWLNSTEYTLDFDEIKQLHAMTSDDFATFFAKDEYLIEYLISKEVTEFHHQEYQNQILGLSMAPMMEKKTSYKPLRQDPFIYESYLSVYDFNDATEKMKQLLETYSNYR